MLMPCLKLLSYNFTIYFRLVSSQEDSEWIDSEINVRLHDELVMSLGPSWYLHDPNEVKELVEILDHALRGVVDQPFEPMDDPTVQFVFNNNNGGLILNLYYGFELMDHLSLYLDNNQLRYLDRYLKLYLGVFNRNDRIIQKMYNEGVLQGD